MFSMLNIGILYLSGENFRFLLFFVTLVSGVCIRIFSLIGCAGSVGISLASRVMYIFRVRIFSLCGVAGRYDFIWSLWWGGWRDCTDFSFSLAL